MRSANAFTLLSITFSIACTGAQVSPPNTVVRDSAGVVIVENSRATWNSPWTVRDEPSLTIGRSTGGSEYEFHNIAGAVRLSDGGVVIANSGSLELRFFDGTGVHRRSVGRRGGGPGEFLSLERIARSASDSLLAEDVVGHRVSFFDSQGRFVRAVRLEPSPEIPAPRPVGFFSDGSLLATHGLYTLGGAPPARVERDVEGLFHFDVDSNRATRLGDFPGRERDVFPLRRPNGVSAFERWPRLFGRSTVYAASGLRFYVADNASYEIKIFSTYPTRLSTVIRLEHDPIEVTEAHMSTLRDSVIASSPAPAKQMIRRSFGDRPAHPQTMPAYAPEIRIDSDRCLWVRDFSPPGSQRISWKVFDPSGVLLGTVTTPAGLRILDIGANYVLGVSRDNDGVEFVALFDLYR